MKRSFCLTVLFCLLIAALVSCGDGSVTTDVTSSTEITTPSTCVTTSVSVDDVLPESVTLSREKLTLYAGSSYSVTATVLPDHADTKAVRFSSSDETVASVSSDGTVRALRVGTAEIKATCIGGVEDSFTVTVIDESAEDYYFYSTFSADTLNPEIQIARSTNGAYEIDDGMLRLTTVDQDYINGKILFDDAIEGYLVAQASVMIETKAFSNLFYFYTSDSTTNGVVCSVAAENRYFKYHNGSSWVNLEPCHLDIFYEIEVILRIGDRVNGAEKGCFDISIDGKWYRDLPLRTGGDGVEDSIRMFFFGSNKPDTGMVYDYLYLKKAQPPYLFLNENEVELDLSKTDSYALSYELAGLPDPTVTVTSAREDGWSYQDGVLTFQKQGCIHSRLRQPIRTERKAKH